MAKYEKIARELCNKYYNYYCTVYISFIVEAVENTIADGVPAADLDAIHEHITENYI